MTDQTLRNQLIEFIRKADPFYYSTCFVGHSDEQLEKIITRIKLQKRGVAPEEIGHRAR